MKLQTDGLVSRELGALMMESGRDCLWLLHRLQLIAGLTNGVVVTDFRLGFVCVLFVPNNKASARIIWPNRIHVHYNEVILRKRKE